MSEPGEMMCVLVTPRSPEAWRDFYGRRSRNRATIVALAVVLTSVAMGADLASGSWSDRLTKRLRATDRAKWADVLEAKHAGSLAPSPSGRGLG